MGRALAFAAVCALLVGLPSPAAADSIEITGGSAFLYWDGSLTSFTISSADSQFPSEHHGSARRGFDGGATVDLSTTIPFSNAGNHPLAATYRDQQFSQAWLGG